MALRQSRGEASDVTLVKVPRKPGGWRWIALLAAGAALAGATLAARVRRRHADC